MFRLWNLRKDRSHKQPVNPRKDTSSETKSRAQLSTSKASQPSENTERNGNYVANPQYRAAIKLQPSPYPNFEIPRLTKTPWELERHQKDPPWRRRRSSSPPPPQMFKSLPREVYDCVLLHLEQSYVQDEGSCPPCFLRDLYNLSLTSRAWDKASTAVMYRRVLVVVNHEDDQLPKLKIKGTSRLKLLRRTLRERQGLARLVRELYLADFAELYQNASIEREEIVNLVASLVFACPSLERLIGFHLPFTQEFDRLSYALSTRTHLKERIWFLAESNTEDSEEDDEDFGAYYSAARDPTERFLELNSRHPTLSTLVLHQDTCQSTAPLNYRAVIGTFQQFPVLRNLTISGLDASSFTNLAMNALPADLESLRLENLSGVTDKGLMRFGTSEAVISMKRLVFINLNITDLATIATYLSPHLAQLQHFCLIQDKAPGVRPQTAIPEFSSPTLRSLHWELRSEASPVPILPPLSPRGGFGEVSFSFEHKDRDCCLATSRLATSIRDGGFPSLNRIRIPHDPQGVIQALCRPLATALLPSDFSTLPELGRPDDISTTLEGSGACQPPQLHTFSAFVDDARTDSAVASPVTLHNYSQDPSTPIGSRLAAHYRILAARKEPYMTVRIYDSNDMLRVNRTVNGFMGRLRSQITYELKPNSSRIFHGEGRLDNTRSHWITHIDDLLVEQDLTRADSWRKRKACGHLGPQESGKSIVNAADLF